MIELANHLAAPSAGMYLADYGADIIKVELPAGDELRRWGHSKDGIGLFFKVVNRNKRTVTADLRTPLGVEIMKRLAETADVVVENFMPGTLARWGVDFDDLRQINADIIMLKVSGFGQAGPNSSRPGFGTLAEAYSGFAYTNGEQDRPPTLPGFGLADATTGLMGAFLVLVALNARAAGMGGQLIDLALYETLYTLLGPHVVDFDQLGIVQARAGSRLPFTAPRNAYLTADKHWVAISGSTQSTFERICGALGLRQLIPDPRFHSNGARLANNAELDEILRQSVAGLTLRELMDRFQQFDAPAQAVYSVDQTLADAHYAAREDVITVADDELGHLRMQNVVGRLSGTPGRVLFAGPPVGLHNREVLVDELGIDEEVLLKAGTVL